MPAEWSAYAIDAARASYLRQAGERHADTVRRAIAICPEPSARVLDIGRSNLSHRLLTHYDSLTTLGLPLEITGRYAHSTGWEPPRCKEYITHIVCNLNDARHIDHLDIDRSFDLIVFAEVLEHLTTAPELVLRLLRSMLRPGGQILCTTPNAVSLNKRVWLALGRNPFNRIRLDPNNPAHFREYTKSELIEVGIAADLTVASHTFVDFMLPGGSRGRRLAVAIAHQIAHLIPPLSASHAIVYRR